MTATLKRIDKKIQDLPPESLRHRVLVALRAFRASWIELGRLLTEVAYGGDYKEWGYDDFDVYCARELGLKKPTVKKLMVSYNYMKRYEPDKLSTFEDGDGNEVTEGLPDYQTVELLHRARESADLDDQEKGRLHTLAFSDETDEGTVRKEIRTALRPGTGEEIADKNALRQREIADILRTARALRQKLAQSRHIPGGLKGRIEELLVELEALD